MLFYLQRQIFLDCSFLAEAIDPNSKDQMHKADLIFCFEFYPFTRTDDIKYHRNYLKHILGWLNEGGKLIIFQRWDNEESLSINFEILVAEFSDYEFQSYHMPMRKLASIIPNRNVSLFLTQILRAIIQKYTRKKMGKNRAIIIKKA